MSYYVGQKKNPHAFLDFPSHGPQAVARVAQRPCYLGDQPRGFACDSGLRLSFKIRGERIHMANSEIQAEDCREYACNRTKETYAKLMSTPASFRESLYAWRENGKVKIRNRPPANGIYGKADGQTLRTVLFAQIHGWQPSSFLTVEEEQEADRATQEIRMRNRHEYRRLEARAVADLLQREARGG